jgi:hypothetical protein
MMITDIQDKGHLIMETQVQTTCTEINLLVEGGLSHEEIVDMLLLRQWYQTEGSDRVQIVRHLEFLKLLVLQGKIEL